MKKTAENQKKIHTKKSQEIIFKKPSLFRVIVSYITAYSMMLLNVAPAFAATNITGVSGNNGVYNIEAAKISGDTGFRQYTDFTLDNGDVANLQFRKGGQDYGKFVNMVDNQININGIVNSVRGDAFYNGHAIFVSPQGIVVGASGVLNVGSLTMAAPHKDKYDDFKEAFNDDDLGDYVHGSDKYKEILESPNGNITINGKIMTRGDVELYGKNITIEGKNGRAGIVAGADVNKKITTQAEAKQIFDNLVSNNINNEKTFSLEGGKIKIKAGATETSDWVKDAKVEVKNADLGADGVDIKAKVESEDKIDLVKTEINIENAHITGNTIDIKAESKREHSLLTDNDYVTGLNGALIEFFTNLIGGDDSSFPFGATGASEAKVTVKDSVLRAIEEDIAINAVATYSHKDNLNLMKPALLMMLIDLFKDNGDDQEIEPDDASFLQFFSSDIYEGFDGPRTRAEVTVDNSEIISHSGDIEISAEASSELNLSTGADGLIIPIAVYGFGTSTVARAIVENRSKLTAEEGNVNVDAFSENTNDIAMLNAGITSLSIEDFFLLAIINNTVKTTTEAKVEGSTVNTKDLKVRAVNVTSSEAEVEIEALAGMSDQAPQQDPQHQTQGNSAVSGIGILHRSDNNVTALIKNSTVTADNVAVLAQSLNSTVNMGDASVDDPMVEKPRPYSWMQWERNVQNKIKDVQRQYINKSLFNRIKGGGGFKGQQGATLEAGGVFVWSNTQNKATAKIENSTITAEKDVSVQANTVDVLRNMATSDTAGEENFSASVTVIINEEENTTTANVDKSKVKAKNLAVNATTEMPMNKGELTIGMKFPFKIKGVDGAYAGFGFDHEANQKWEWDFVHPKVDSEAPAFDMADMTEQPIGETYGNLKPKIRWKGFFNNFAQTNGIGQKVAVDGSFIYNGVENNTTASITGNSDITLNAVEKDGKFEGGNLTVNAVNSVIGYNALGMIDILIRQINYRIPGQINWQYEPQVEAGKFGLGVNFLWDTYTNNAVAKIDNSKVEAAHGKVRVSAANEQEYVTAAVTGGKSEFIGLEGSTNVQKRYGETTAQILNSEKINAGNVEVNAGKATIRTAGNKPKTDENTQEAKLKAERDAEDVMTIINFLPAWSVETAEQEAGQQTTSSGVAIGAGVDVTNIERDITAEIKNSTVVSEKDVDVKADTYGQTLNLIAAAAWSGGIKQPEQQGGQQGGGNEDNQPANQNDIGNVQQNLDNAQDEEENIFGNLFDGEEDFMQQPVGNALNALRNKFSLSVAGAVLVFNDKTDVGAKVSGSNLTVGNNVNVTADRETRMITVSGGIGKSGKIGVGAAVDIYKSDGSVKANVADSTIKFNSKNANPQLNVKAHNTNKVLNIAIGAGLAPGSDVNNESIKVAIGGSYNMNTLKPEIEATVQNSTIEATSDSNKPDVTVKAENDVTLYDIAGGGSYISGGSTGLGVGAAINYNNIKHTISAYVTNSVLKNINKLSVIADADNDLADFAVAGTLAVGADTSGWTFDGSAVVDYIHDTLAAKVLGSTVDAADDIIVRADSLSDNLGVTGTLDISLTNSGAGVNGNVVINVFRNNVTAEIGDSYKEVKNNNGETETVLDRKSKILKAKDIEIAATSTEKSNVIAIGTAVGTGGQFLMAAANVVVNLIDNTVKAYLSGDVGKGEGATAVHDATVAAYDETTLYSRGGTVGVNTSQDAFAVFAGSVNVDKIDKTVEAKIKNADIKANGDVSATAYSVNSLGGTKNDDNKYTRDDVTSEAYREKMLHKDADTDEYDGLKLKKKEDGDGDDAYVALHQDSDFWNWNMFYDISASYKAATISGTGIGKVISNTVTAEITGSKIEADNLNVIANDYSIKNIIAGTIGGSGLGSVGLQVLYTKDNSTTSALITNGSELTVTNALNMDATNAKDNHQILVVGVGAKNFAAEGNLAINKMTDKAIAKIDNGSTQKTIKAGTIAISANEDMNASHIVVAGGGAEMGAITVSPLINTYDGTTEAVIENASIKDAAIDMDAESDIDTLDVSVGVAGAKNAGGVGIAIKNDYSNKVKSYIDTAVINTARNIFIDANSVIDTVNWLVGIGGAGQGVGVVVDVLLNDVHSELEAGIKNSTIEKSGAITINTNKDKKDKIVNRAIAAAAVFEGATPVVSVIKNVYENTVKSYVDNTGSTEIASLSVNANSDRRTENANIGFSAAGEGAALLAAATVHEITSTTEAYVDAKSKTLNITGALTADAKDQMVADNKMAAISGGIYGGGLDVNVDLFHSDNLVKAEILSAANGQINAGSSALNSEVTNAHNNTHLDLTFGLGAIPVDVQIIEIGKRTGTYSDVEKPFVDEVNSSIPESLYTPITDSDKIETGAISRVAGNLKTADDIVISAKTQLKGLDVEGNLIDQLKIDNKHVTAAGLEINVGVRKLNLAGNTVAEISGGKVESTQGDVELNAESKSDVKIDSTSVEVGGGQVSGRDVSYKNSAETTAQIKNTTVNAKDIDVNAKSDNKALMDATDVIVALVGVVTVDLVEAIDTSKNAALITGNTDINATGTLSLHANATSDVSSLKTSVPVQIGNVVGVSRNRAEVSSVARAIIEEVNGTIKTNGLNITTDYDKMYVYSKSNIVAVKPIDIASYDDSGAFMNASFKSGIDSEAGLTLINNGTTDIITAKDNQADQSGMVALGNIHDVHVSLVNFYSGAFSKAENTATSSTVLKVKDHTANNLNIEQYLNSSATAEASKTKVTLLGFCGAVSADAKDTSTMDFDIGGSNTILQSAIINATHDSKIKSDLFNFNLGVVVSGGRIRIDSYLTSATTGNIGGKFNAGNADINVYTSRDSYMSKGSGTGGFINVSDTEVHNTLIGDSILNIKNVTSDADNINNWNITNKSENIFDVNTRDGSGGFLNVSLSNLFTNFKTSTETNIENSDINSSGKVKFEVNNKEIFKDSAWSNGGGVISVINNYTKNDYTAGAKLAVKDSRINAGDLELKVLSDMRTATNDYIAHTGAGGGFIAVSNFTLINNLTQTSEIDIQNSELHAVHNAVIQALTSSMYKQKMDADYRGFVAVPRFSNTLDVTNNNKITLDDKSKISADNELDIGFDSSNDLAVRTSADARNFEGVPAAWSYLYLTINNMLENSGSLQAGNLVDINFMKKSTNNLTQYAHTENDAFIASTTEDGILSRTINNTLNVNTGAEIVSGKDIDMNYSIGVMNPSSEVSWVTDSLWFIEDSDKKSVDTPSNNYSLKNDGRIVAGQGNNRYMKINRDRTIDTSTLQGFYEDDYTLFNAEEIDGQKIKEKNLAAIHLNILSIEGKIGELEQTITDLETVIDNLNAQKDAVQEKIDELNGLIADGYVLTEAKSDADGTSVNTMIQNDLNALIIGEEEDKITQEQYEKLISDYNDYLTEISVYYYGHEEKIEAPTISEFLTDGNYDLTEEQIQTIGLNYGKTDADIVGTANNQISREKYDEIVAAYREKLAEVDVYNYGHAEEQSFKSVAEFLADYNFTDAQKATLIAAYNTINANTHYTPAGSYKTYENASGKYIAVTDLTATETGQTFKEMTQLQEETELLTNQINAYDSLKTSDEAKVVALNSQMEILNAAYDETSAADPEQYQKNNDTYSIVFNDIDSKSSHININGAYNNHISGSGVFNIATGGLKIDNYSTRALIFNRVNIDATTDSGLVIGGKNQYEFADKDQAVSGANAYYYFYPSALHSKPNFDDLPTDGVHYTTGGDGTMGVTINNWYDVNHPFADTFEDIPNPTAKSGIFFKGSIGTNLFNVRNESGDIIFTTPTITAGKMNLYATNGAVNVIMNSDDETAFVLNSGSNIFAADGVSVNADSVDIQGNIKTGYAARSITITEDMLKAENLIVDPTSGEKNMIDFGGEPSVYLNAENNIKAIYKDGQIYLYDIPETVQNNGVQIAKVNGENASGTVSGRIETADGYQTITIDNQTDKQLNVAGIANTYSEGGLSADGVATDRATIIKTGSNHAETNITSGGKIVLNGVINNNVRKGSDDYMVQNTDGILNITANNGLDISEITESDTVKNTIFAGGRVDITITGGESNFAGKITDKGNITITDTGTGNLVIGGDITDTFGNISIHADAQTDINADITVNNGRIDISAKGLTLAEDAEIFNKKGDITVTGDTAAMSLGGDIETQAGNITVINNGAGGAEITGNIKTVGGNTEIRNTAGDFTFGADSGVFNEGEGNIVIANTGDGKLTLGGMFENKVAGDIIVTNSGANGVEIAGTVINEGGNTTIKNQKSDLLIATGSILQNTVPSNIVIKNTVDAMALTIAGTIGAEDTGNITIDNAGAGALEVVESGIIRVTEGTLSVTNANTGALKMAGLAESQKGNTVFTNTSADGMIVTTTGQIINRRHDIELNNSGAAGTKIEGKISALRQSVILNNTDSDLIIGEYESANDNYIEAESGSVVITQVNGNVLNGVVDTSGAKHQNADLGNPEHSYKTLIVADGNLTINVTNGNIGATDADNPASSVEASTRDWTDSVNVNVSGNITAVATNDNKSDARLINLRAKDSDLKVKKVEADGDVLLTAADWKQADARPTPQNDRYFQGYSIVNTSTGNNPAVFGQNISLIAANNIGTANKKMTYLQDTLANPQSMVSFEAENNIYMSGDATSGEGSKINQMVAKRGSIVLDLNKDTVINEITAGKSLEITQKAQNLTLLEVGMPAEGTTFDDMLYAHDDLVWGKEPNTSNDKSVVPQNVIIRVLDATDTPERGDSNLKVYSMNVRGNNNENANYYSTGGRLADVTLMADNIYANSDKAPDSSVPTKANPTGYKQTQTSYNAAQFGFADTGEHQAKGINSYGEGEALSVDILGVDENTVKSKVANPQRETYDTQKPNENNPSKFGNGADAIYNTHTQNAVLSLNDYAVEERGVVFDALYADNVYLNTMDTSLDIRDGYVGDYAEIRNGNRATEQNRHTVIIDNDYRRLLPANVQLYTAKTGNFALMMNEKIKLLTPAPVTHYEWDKLVKTFNDENSFVRLGLKETELRQKAKDYYADEDVYAVLQGREPDYDVWNDDEPNAGIRILEISRTGAVIVNRDNWQLGEEHELELMFEDIKAKLKCVVTKVERNLATVKFTDIPASIADKLTDRYVKTAAR